MLFVGLRRALNPREPLCRRECGTGRRAARYWKLAGLLVILAVYALWFYRLWALQPRWSKHNWKVALLAAALVSGAFVLLSLVAFLLGYRSVRGEVSGGTAEALVMTSASRLRLVFGKLRGSMELLAIAALLLPLYCLVGMAGGSEGQAETYIHGGLLRWMTMGHSWSYEPFCPGAWIVGLCAFASDVSWYLLFAACGIWTAVSRRHWSATWLKGLGMILLVLVVSTVVGRIGMDMSMDLRLADVGGGDSYEGLFERLADFFTELPDEGNSDWLALGLLGANVAWRLLAAQFLLLRAASRFDVIALDLDRPARRFKPGFWRKAAMVASAAVVLLAAGACLWLRHIDREHQRLLAEARERLLALNFEPPPEEENAAPLYEKAYSLFATNPKDYGLKFTSQLEAFKLEIGSDAVAQLLKSESATLAALEQAADRPQCVFVSDYSAGAYTKSPSLYNTRAAALLLSIAARRAAHDGDYTQAVARIRQMLCLGRGIGQPRFFINNMIMAAIEDIACRTIQDVLTQTEPDEKSLNALMASLEEHCRLAPACRDALRTEHIVHAYNAAELAATLKWRYGRQDPWDTFKLRVRRSLGLTLRDARDFESLFREKDEALALPFDQAYRRLERLAKDSDIGKRMDSLGNPYSIFTTSVFRSATSCRTLVNCARLAAACRLHQLKTGTPPENLAELAGYFPDDFAEVATDPFSGRRLRYRRNETGFVVYSVGAWDPRDNGASDPYANPDDPDLAFAVDRRLWEDYRAKRIEQNQKLKNRRPGIRGAVPGRPKAPARP